MEKYRQKQRYHERDRKRKSHENREVPRAAPSSELSRFSPSQNNPSPCVDLPESCFLIKEEDEREEEGHI